MKRLRVFADMLVAVSSAHSVAMALLSTKLLIVVNLACSQKASGEGRQNLKGDWANQSDDCPVAGALCTATAKIPVHQEKT